MSTLKNIKMSPTDPATLTECQKQIRAPIELLHDILDGIPNSLESVPVDQREFLEADLCLASRSAYFDFYTWVVLHGEIDTAAERELDSLFQQALAVLSRAGQYRDSVEQRYKEFKAKCRQVRTGGPATMSSYS